MAMISEAAGRSFLERPPIPVDLQVVCFWSILGLLSTVLLLALGFGAEIGPALAMGKKRIEISDTCPQPDTRHPAQGEVSSWLPSFAS